MRVALRISGNYVWLAGKPGTSEREFSSVSGFRVNGEISVQTDSKIRGAAVVERDRRNLRTTLAFGTVRKFDTAVEAELFALDYDGGTRQGTLILEIPQPGGGVTRRYMAGAVVRPPERLTTGVSVALQYTVTGGAIASSPPAGEPA